MAPLAFLASATSLSLSSRFAHSFISSPCGSGLGFHHHRSHSLPHLLMNSLACTGCLQLHLGTLLNCFTPTNITFLQLLQAPWSASSIAWFAPAPNLLILFTDKNIDLPSVFRLIIFWTCSIFIFGYVVRGRIAGKLWCRNYVKLMVWMFHLSIGIFHRISCGHSPLQTLCLIFLPKSYVFKQE